MISGNREIGQRIDCFRQDKGWSKSRLSKELGIRPQNINRYLEGESDPSKIIIKLIGFGLNLQWLRTGEGSMYSDKEALKDYETSVKRIQSKYSGGLLRAGSPLYDFPPNSGMMAAAGVKMCVEGIIEGDMLYLDFEKEPKEGELVLKKENGVPAVSRYKQGDPPPIAVITRLQRDLLHK